MPLSPQSDEFRRIEQFILRNNPQPGEKVATEDEIIQALHVTRYKARQAFDLLMQMGILERFKRRGTIVKRLTTRDMTHNILEQLKLAGFDQEEFSEARLMIETAVVPYVIRRMTPATFSQLKNLCLQVRNHASEPTKADAFSMEFHLLVLKSAGNRVIEIFASVIRTYFSSTRHMVENVPPSFFKSWADVCEDFLCAVREQNESRAVEQLRTLVAGKFD